MVKIHPLFDVNLFKLVGGIKFCLEFHVFKHVDSPIVCSCSIASNVHQIANFNFELNNSIDLKWGLN